MLYLLLLLVLQTKVVLTLHLSSLDPIFHKTISALLMSCSKMSFHLVLRWPFTLFPNTVPENSPPHCVVLHPYTVCDHTILCFAFLIMQGMADLLKAHIIIVFLQHFLLPSLIGVIVLFRYFFQTVKLLIHFLPKRPCVTSMCNYGLNEHFIQATLCFPSL